MERLSEELRNNRIKNSARNMLTGFLLMITVTVFPFVIRTLMVRYLGDQLLGLNGVLQSTVMLLNMAELGLGTVVVYFVYKPAANGDIKTVNAFLAEIRKLYLFVAVFIMIAGLLLCFFIPKIVGDEQVADINVRFAYLIFLAATVLPYLIWPEAGIILNAYQRRDIQNIVSIIVQIGMYVLQIIAICVMKSYFTYVVLILIQGVVLSSYQHIMSKRCFPDLNVEGKLKFDEAKAIRVKLLSMIGHQLDEKLINNVDTLFISALLGLKYVTIYGNYIYVVTALSMIVSVVYDSALASIGNAIATETTASNRIRFECIFFLSAVISGWSTMCLISMYQPFMQIWMPDLLLTEHEMVFFCIFSYCGQMRKSIQMFKNAAGMWEKDKWKPYVSMAADVVLNILLIHLWGIVGAIIASIICIAIIELPWEVHVLFRQYFQTETKRFYFKFAKYTVVNIFLIIFSFFVLDRIVLESGFIELVLRGLICTLFSAIYLIVYRKSREFEIWKETIFTLIPSKSE